MLSEIIYTIPLIFVALVCIDLLTIWCLKGEMDLRSSFHIASTSLLIVLYGRLFYLYWTES
jgi:hypothetical protein